jgi:hypothetical protein
VKEPLRFRAIPRGKEAGIGPLAIQSSLTGEIWITPVSGLTAEDVKKEFTRLKAHGAVIVDTAAYKHEDMKKA